MTLHSAMRLALALHGKTMESAQRPVALVHKGKSVYVVLHLIPELEQDVTQKRRILFATLKR